MYDRCTNKMYTHTCYMCWKEWVVQIHKHTCTYICICMYVPFIIVSSSWLNCVTVAFPFVGSIHCGAGSVRGVRFLFRFALVYGVCVPVSVVVSNISAWLATDTYTYICILCIWVPENLKQTTNNATHK